MALEVEDGTAKATSESYASVADADTYLANAGYETWDTMSTAEKEEALRRATRYMQQTYRLRWKGYRTTLAQALDWPRGDVDRPDTPGGYGSFPAYYDNDVVPSEVVYACIELAYRAAHGELAADLSAAVIKREKVGPIEREYADGARKGIIEYRAVDALLAPLLQGEGVSTFVPIFRM